MLDKTIDSALINLRKQIIRGDLDGLEHVNALLVTRGVYPGILPPSYRRFTQSKRGDTKRAIIAALTDGPKRPSDVARHMCQQMPSLSYQAASARVHQALARMAASGLVKREGRLWGLVP